MTFTSRTFLILGAILLSHACYSAHEHSSLHAKAPSSTASAQSSSAASISSTALPLDISLETVASVFLICIGVVLGAEQLKPIIWRVWAGQIEKESGGGGPFQALEDRMGFMDIRAQRKDFADWVREKGSVEGK
ncbi:MAG: hypothetical protein L6R41_005392 [Letrouitia leprolyta]|nr:MAG: hypothetical protein L6R41_005392 [Letrouitia leprolyta]